MTLNETIAFLIKVRDQYPEAKGVGEFELGIEPAINTWIVDHYMKKIYCYGGSIPLRLKQARAANGTEL